MNSDEIARFVAPARVFSRVDVLARPSAVPAQDGVYGWWFRQIPPPVRADGCHEHDGLRLLYPGISPDRPRATAGRRASAPCATGSSTTTPATRKARRGASHWVAASPTSWAYSCGAG